MQLSGYSLAFVVRRTADMYVQQFEKNQHRVMKTVSRHAVRLGTTTTYLLLKIGFLRRSVAEFKRLSPDIQRWTSTKQIDSLLNRLRSPLAALVSEVARRPGNTTFAQGDPKKLVLELTDEVLNVMTPEQSEAVLEFVTDNIKSYYVLLEPGTGAFRKFLCKVLSCSSAPSAPLRNRRRTTTNNKKEFLDTMGNLDVLAHPLLTDNFNNNMNISRRTTSASSGRRRTTSRGSYT